MTPPLHHPHEAASNAARDQAARYEPRCDRSPHGSRKVPL